MHTTIRRFAAMLALSLACVSAAVAAEPLIVRGQVAVLVEREAVMVRVDVDRDGLIDHTFRFQTADAATLQEQLLEDAQVTYAGNSLDVVSLDTLESLTFTLTGIQRQRDPHTTNLEGRALSYVAHPTRAEIESGAAKPRLHTDTFANDRGRSAGGPGSTSCSISDPLLGCSITCSAGYYACCTGATCKCKRGS